jgi:glycerol-3-phosphate dehydrogenase
MEILGRASQGGAVALNYCEALALLSSRGKALGVTATDRSNGTTHDFLANTVINASGPWAREVGARLHQDLPRLFYPSLAWNLLLDKAPLSDRGLAVSSRKAGGQTYFLVPWKGRILAGTGHAPWHAGPENPVPTPEQVEHFLSELNTAAPGLQASLSNIIHVFSGLLPVKETGGTELTTRELIVDHAQQGGPEGLYSVAGVKFTTARLVADRLLSKVFPARTTGPENGHQPLDRQPPLREIIAHSGVMHLDDLLLRRLPFPEDPAMLLLEAKDCCALFDWEETRRREELARVAAFFNMPQQLINSAKLIKKERNP